MNKIIKLEAFIASPPTSKCLELIGVLEEVVRRHPDELRLVVFRRGVDFVPDEIRQEISKHSEDMMQKKASTQMRVLIQKGSAVPSCVLDGVLFSSLEVPGLEALEAKVKEILG